MVSQVPKMEPQGLQNNSFTYKKLPISAVDQLTYQHMLFGGPAAGGEALKYYIFSRELCMPMVWALGLSEFSLIFPDVLS